MEMFYEIRKCIDEYERISKKYESWERPTGDDLDVLEFLDLHLAKAIIKDFHYADKGEKLAKIILATLGMSNEIKINID